MSRITAAAILMTIAGSAASSQSVPGNADPTAVQAGVYAVEPAHTRVQFSVSHMGFTNWYGDFTSVSGSLSLDPARIATAKLDISIPVATVATTNAKLDAELKGADWFDAGAYPTIRFVSTRVVPTGAGTATISGNLTFHGVTRPVDVKARFNGGGINPLSKAYTIGFDGTTTIARSAFGVKSYVPMIGDETSLRISAAFEKSAG